MKKLNVTLIYSMLGQTSIEVPDEMTIEEAISYAQNHIRDISIPTDGTYLCESESIDEENCDFDNEDFDDCIY